MPLDELRAALAPRDGVVTIHPSTVPSELLRELLTRYNGGAPLVIKGAAPGPGDGPGRLVIAGSGELFGYAMPLVATLESDGAVGLTALLEYTPPAGWTFAAAFPHMPRVVDHSLPPDTAPAPLLDLLANQGALSSPAFVLSSHGEHDEARQIDLLPGWNVVCRFSADKAAGFLGALLAGRELALAGPLAPGEAPDVEPADDELPDLGRSAPAGILLSAGVGDITLGHLPLTASALVIYTPLDSAWAEQPGAYGPVVGVRGDLQAGDALVVPAEAITPVGASSLLLNVEVAHASIAGLEGGAQLAGGDDLHSAIPADLLELVKGIGPLRVRELSLGVQRAHDGNQSVDYAALSLGLHDISWPVIPSFVEVGAIDATFFVNQPLATDERQVGALLDAALIIGATTLDVSAQLPSGAVVAKLPDGATIPLGDVLAKHLPGVKPPGDLTVVELSLSALPAPASSYLIQSTIHEYLPIKLGHTDLMLDGLAFSLGYEGGAASGSILGWVEIAGAQFFASARHPQSGGWVFAGGLSEGETLRLAALLTALLPGDIALPSALEHIQITALSLSWDSLTGAFSFMGQATEQWSVQLGPRAGAFTAALTIQTTVDQQTGARSTTGALSGTLQLEGIAFHGTYAFRPGEHTLVGEWASADAPLHHSALGAAFGTALVVPAGREADLSVTRLRVALDLSAGAGDTLELEGDSAHYGQAFFILKRDTAGAWNAALIVALPASARLSELPAVGEELRPLDFITFSSAFALLASGTITSLPLPPLSQHALAPLRVDAGLRLCAVVDFSGEGEHSVTLRSMCTLTGADVLLMQAVIDEASGTELVAELEGGLVITMGKKSVRLADAAVIIRPAPLVSFNLRGALQFKLKDDVIDAAGMITVSEDQATCAFEVKSEQRYLPIPMGFRGVHLTEIGVAMGLVFTPPQLELGLQGNFIIGEPGAVAKAPTSWRPAGAMPASDEFVIILGFEDVIPNPLLLSMYLDELDLGTVITALTDRRPDLPALLTEIRASQLMLYWCDEPILQPDGTPATPFFGLNANLDLLGFPAHTSLFITALPGGGSDTGAGIRGDASIAPIHIDGVVDLTGAGTGTPAGYTGAVAIPAGGGVVHVSTTGQPYLLADWDLRLFRTFEQKVHAEITRDGFAFTVDYGVAGVFASRLACALRSHTHFTMAFAVALRLDIGPITVAGVHLGSIRLGETGLAASLDAQLAPELALTIDGSFSYDGHTLRLPTIHLAVAPESLEHLPELIRDAVRDGADQIFKEIYDEAERIIHGAEADVRNLWADWEQEEQRLAQELKAELDGIEADIQREIGAIRRDAEAAIAAVEDEARRISDAVRRDLDKLDTAMSETEEEVHRLEQEAAAEAARLAHGVESAAATAAHDAAQAVSDAARTVKGWVVEAGRDIKHFFKHIF